MEPLVEALRMENFTAASAGSPAFLLTPEGHLIRKAFLICTCAVTRFTAGLKPTANAVAAQELRIFPRDPQ